jgi:hypothetical protein
MSNAERIIARCFTAHTTTHTGRRVFLAMTTSLQLFEVEEKYIGSYLPQREKPENSYSRI